MAVLRGILAVATAACVLSGCAVPLNDWGSGRDGTDDRYQFQAECRLPGDGPWDPRAENQCAGRN